MIYDAILSHFRAQAASLANRQYRSSPEPKAPRKVAWLVASLLILVGTPSGIPRSAEGPITATESLHALLSRFQA